MKSQLIANANLSPKVLFMGFCPNAEGENSEIECWKNEGVCTLSPFDKNQTKRFNKVNVGDLVVLKKIKNTEFGRTITLYGHGRVKSIAFDKDGNRLLVMRWTIPNKIIDVSLWLAQTVHILTREEVEKMSEAFFEWLQEPITVTLDTDVAKVFTTTEAVNNALRGISSALSS